VALDKPQCHDILDAAWDLGIRWLDTARSYGESEKIIGSHPKPWLVTSKGDSPAEKETSIQLLSDKLTYYLIHHVGNRRTIPPWADGVSVYSPTNIQLSSRSAVLTPVFNFPLSLIDQRFHTHVRHDAMRVARSIFIQGRAFTIPDVLGIPFYHLCWNFAVYHPNVDRAVFGVDSVVQLEDLLRIPRYTISYHDNGVQWSAV
jgi:aryl-alcohol dehydrogenase-like predicted oxidoreductase